MGCYKLILRIVLNLAQLFIWNETALLASSTSSGLILSGAKRTNAALNAQHLPTQQTLSTTEVRAHWFTVTLPMSRIFVGVRGCNLTYSAGSN
jgi:hypothetical protein